jgi:non-ribosomal peptide synthetase component F
MGDVVSVQLIDSWLALYPHAAAINAYGPTEASDDIMENVIRAPLPAGQVAVPIGRPLANLSLYLLDTQRRPVPLGVPGELYVAGIGVGEGYFDDPAKTAAAFFDNPFDPAARACTAPATSRSTSPTARCTSWAASTTR